MEKVYSSSKNVMITHITRMGFDHLCLAGIDVDRVLSDAELSDCNIRPLLSEKRSWSIKDLEDIELYGIYKFYGYFESADGSKEDFTTLKWENVDLDKNLKDKIFHKYESHLGGYKEAKHWFDTELDSFTASGFHEKDERLPYKFKFDNRYFLLYFAGKMNNEIMLSNWFPEIESRLEDNLTVSDKKNLIYSSCSHADPWTTTWTDICCTSMRWEVEDKKYIKDADIDLSKIFYNIHISNNYHVSKFQKINPDTVATVRTEDLLYYRREPDGQQRVIINTADCPIYLQPDFHSSSNHRYHPTNPHLDIKSIDIPITDYRFFDYDKVSNSFINKPFSEIEKLFNSGVAYVSIGLTRSYMGSRWLQLNNFHFVNDLLIKTNLTDNTFEMACPLCKAEVLDHRENKPSWNFPHFRCSNEECDQGNGYPWSSWNEDEFD